MDAQVNQIYTAILIAIVVVVSIIALFILSVIKQQRKVLELQRKNINAEITAIELERARIALDLHDHLSPMLCAVKMKINSFELIDSEDLVQLEKTNRHMDEVVDKVRTISFNLMPHTLEKKGLFTALQEFVSFIVKKDGLRINFTTPDTVPVIQPSNAIHIYRIVQEIVHNTLKHAHASELVLTFHNKPKKLMLTAEDNGAGFDYDQTLKNDTGLGLRSLHNRMYLLKGHMEVESKPGQGTVITLEIPI